MNLDDIEERDDGSADGDLNESMLSTSHTDMDISQGNITMDSQVHLSMDMNDKSFDDIDDDSAGSDDDSTSSEDMAALKKKIIDYFPQLNNSTTFNNTTTTSTATNCRSNLTMTVAMDSSIATVLPRVIGKCKTDDGSARSQDTQLNNNTAATTTNTLTESSTVSSSTAVLPRVNAEYHSSIPTNHNNDDDDDEYKKSINEQFRVQEQKEQERTGRAAQSYQVPAAAAAAAATTTTTTAATSNSNRHHMASTAGGGAVISSEKEIIYLSSDDDETAAPIGDISWHTTAGSAKGSPAWVLDLCSSNGVLNENSLGLAVMLVDACKVRPTGTKNELVIQRFSDSFVTSYQSTETMDMDILVKISREIQDYINNISKITPLQLRVAFDKEKRTTPTAPPMITSLSSMTAWQGQQEVAVPGLIDRVAPPIPQPHNRVASDVYKHCQPITTRNYMATDPLQTAIGYAFQVNLPITDVPVPTLIGFDHNKKIARNNQQTLPLRDFAKPAPAAEAAPLAAPVMSTTSTFSYDQNLANLQRIFVDCTKSDKTLLPLLAKHVFVSFHNIPFKSVVTYVKNLIVNHRLHHSSSSGGNQRLVTNTGFNPSIFLDDKQLMDLEAIQLFAQAGKILSEIVGFWNNKYAYTGKGGMGKHADAFFREQDLRSVLTTGTSSHPDGKRITFYEETGQKRQATLRLPHGTMYSIDEDGSGAKYREEILSKSLSDLDGTDHVVLTHQIDHAQSTMGIFMETKTKPGYTKQDVLNLLHNSIQPITEPAPTADVPQILPTPTAEQIAEDVDNYDCLSQSERGIIGMAVRKKRIEMLGKLPPAHIRSLNISEQEMERLIISGGDYLLYQRELSSHATKIWVAASAVRRIADGIVLQNEIEEGDGFNFGPGIKLRGDQKWCKHCQCITGKFKKHLRSAKHIANLETPASQPEIGAPISACLAVLNEPEYSDLMMTRYKYIAWCNHCNKDCQMLFPSELVNPWKINEVTVRRNLEYHTTSYHEKKREKKKKNVN